MYSNNTDGKYYFQEGRRIGIRVNPMSVEGEIAMTATATPSSKFGIPLTEKK